MGPRPGALILRREDDGQVICESCVVADTMPRRMRGLLGRRELPPGEGVVLRPGWSIHTAFVRFPIDVVFIDADQVVVRVVRNLKPWRAKTCRGARDVVELAAGECERIRLEPGDRVTWAARTAEGIERAHERAAEIQRPAVDTNGGPPPRVLLATRDDRFLRLARFLLLRHDFDVEWTKKMSGAFDLVERRRPDVVVVDTTEALTEAAQTVGALAALHPNLPVRLVYDGQQPKPAVALHMTDKWLALETLVEDIRVATAGPRPWS